jgi:hypothetical protein
MAANALPNQAIWLISAGEYLPWYELKELKLVCKDWKEAIDETFEHNSAWQQIIDYLNSKNTFHCCEDCVRPFLPDGTSDDLCTSGVCQCGCNNVSPDFLQALMLRTFIMMDFDDNNEDDDASRSVNFDPRMSTNPRFTSLPLQTQAKQLFQYHRICISVLSSAYKDILIDFSDDVPVIVEDDELYELQEYNPSAYRLLMTMFILSIARDNLKTGPEPTYLPLVAPVESHDRHLTSFVNLIADYAATELVEDLEYFLSKTLEDRRSKTAESLLGPKLAESIDMLQDVRKTFQRDRDSMFPLEWMPCMDRDFDSDFSNDDYDDDEEDSILSLAEFWTRLENFDLSDDNGEVDA